MIYIFYLIPIIVLDGVHGPKYFDFAMEPDPTKIQCAWAIMKYGWSPYGLLVAKDISQEDQDFLALQSDVFRFPDNLDGPVDQAVQAFFEGIHLPTDWMTPATTWRELMRQTAGMFQFNQRYGGLSVTYPLDMNQGTLALSESPFSITDIGQDFVQWANSNWMITVQVTLDMGGGETRPGYIRGWIANAIGGAQVEVYKDRLLLEQGWVGEYYPEQILSVDSYFIASGYPRSIFDTATLDTRLRQMTAQEQAWFLATVESFGFDPALVSTNSRLRQLVKAAGNYWVGRTFYLGGIAF